MRKLLLLAVLFQLFLVNPLLSQQQEEPEQLGLPGDNLNLYAVLKLFTESPTLEGFEKSLNDESNNINNLDLDGDNNIDYIRVEDNAEGDLHNIVLKVAVSNKEDQDIAVILVRKMKDGQVEIQVIGDEDLYGKDYIIEPNYSNTDASAETPNPGYQSTQANTSAPVISQTTTTYQVATWPVVRFIFRPSYVIWRSPWHWQSYPTYWRPWRPHYWHYYYGYHYHWNYYYYGHYRYWPHYRYPNWHNYYYGGRFRSRSVIFQTRFSRGDYRTTYGRPDMARQGSAVFVNRYPKAPSAHAKLPAFDKGGTNRPIVARPAPKPGPGAGIRPSPEKPSIERPGTRPVNPTPKPGITRPVTRPAPTPKPGITRPVTRPAPTPDPTPRPITRPAPTRPAPTRPAPKPVTRPVTRPVTTQPTPRPQPRPVTRPSTPPKTREVPRN
jgi:hypothetical protein